jgi:acetoin utilization protein AcuB
MVTKKISSVPVTEQGRLVGIVTETDALQFLVKAMGAAEPSSRLDVVLKDEPAALTDVMTTIEASGMRISSMMTLAGLSGRREVAIRVTPINADPAIKALEAKGYIVRDSWRG